MVHGLYKTPSTWLVWWVFCTIIYLPETTTKGTVKSPQQRMHHQKSTTRSKLKTWNKTIPLASPKMLNHRGPIGSRIPECYWKTIKLSNSSKGRLLKSPANLLTILHQSQPGMLKSNLNIWNRLIPMLYKCRKLLIGQLKPGNTSRKIENTDRVAPKPVMFIMQLKLVKMMI